MSGGSEGRLISMTLRTGVGVSAILLLVGLILSANEGGGFLNPHAIEQLPRDLAALRGRAMIHAGVLLLMLTPITRVMVVATDFIRRKELAFAMISIGVLLLLMTTVIIGLWGVLK